MSGDDEASALAERVEAGGLPRVHLELLATLGHADARKALGSLPLLLDSPPALRWPEDPPPATVHGFRRLAEALSAMDRRWSVEAARACVRRLHADLSDDEPGGAAHVALHTGPAGAIVLERAEADLIFPLHRTIGAVLDGDAAAASEAWHPWLRERLRAELFADLAEIDPRVVWAARWLVATHEDEAHGVAAATCVAWTAAALDDPPGVRALLRDALALVLAP